jgi:asparagine synthase (glutamine-hydrolysing)
MCGIAGSINTAIDNTTLDLIKHRGPDYQSLVEETIAGSSVYLGHTRLSILDLSEAGNQPMYTACGNYCIIFNGEIYNHLELRKKLAEYNSGVTVILKQYFITSASSE